MGSHIFMSPQNYVEVTQKSPRYIMVGHEVRKPITKIHFDSIIGRCINCIQSKSLVLYLDCKGNKQIIYSQNSRVKVRITKALEVKFKITYIIYRYHFKMKPSKLVGWKLIKKTSKVQLQKLTEVYS